MRMAIVALLVVATATRTCVADAADCGDADGDGSVTVTDGVQALRAAAGLSSSCSLARCDADGNGVVTVTDGVNVLRIVAGLPNEALCATGDCVNVAGGWNVDETLDYTCCVDGDCESDTRSTSGLITFEQTGCEVSYTVPGFDVVRTGSISGRHIVFSGPFVLILGDEVSIRENHFTAEGDIEGNDAFVIAGSGRAAGSVEGDEFECFGDSVGAFQR